MNAFRISSSLAQQVQMLLANLRTALNRRKANRLLHGRTRKVNQPSHNEIQPQEIVLPLLLTDEDLIDDLMERLNRLAASYDGKTIVINENPHWLVEM